MRISFAKSPFERSYGEKFTQEAFSIKDRYLLRGVPVYKIADLKESLVEGVFYNSDLTRIIKTMCGVLSAFLNTGGGLVENKKCWYAGLVSVLSLILIFLSHRCRSIKSESLACACTRLCVLVRVYMY